MSMLWGLIGCDKPMANTDRHLQFVKALERLLLVSTAGAFFFALARNIPIHAQEFSWYPNWDYTFDRVLRYLCLAWFLAYFFVSSVHNDLLTAPRRPKDIGFDIVQSISVLAATYSLGFVLPDRGFGFDDGLHAFLFSNIVVIVICMLSLWLFSDEKSPGLTRVRWAGALFATIAALIAWCGTRGTVALVTLLVFQGLLWIVWWAYFCLRRDFVPSE